MQKLHTTKNEKVDFLLAPLDYGIVYSSLEALLGIDAQILAKPFISNKTTDWYALHDEEIQLLKDLSHNIKETTLKEISILEERILTKIQKHNSSRQGTQKKDFDRIAQHLFTHPQGILDWFVFKKDQNWCPVLINWGMRPTSQKTNFTSPSVGTPDVPTETSVTLKFVNQFNESLIKEPFQLEIHKSNNEIVSHELNTNENGEKYIGNFLSGGELTVFRLVAGEKTDINSIKIVKQQNVYEIIFPARSDALVRVIDQNNRPLSQKLCRIITKEGQSVYETDKSGEILLTDLIINSAVQIATDENFSRKESFNVEKQSNIFIIRLSVRQVSTITIEVQNQFEETRRHYPLLLNYGKVEKQVKTNSKGRISLKNIDIEIPVSITDGKNVSNSQSFTIADLSSDFYVFKIKDMSINLTDKKGQPIKDQLVFIELENHTYEGKTDHSGRVKGISELDLPRGSKVSIEVPLDRNSDYKKIQLK